MYFKVVLLLVIPRVYVLTKDANTCTTPNNEKAYCISLFSCPGLMKSLCSLESSSIQNVHRSICPIGGPGELFVCCGKSDRKDSKNVTDRSPPLPIIEKPTKKPSQPTHDHAKINKTAIRETVKQTLIPNKRYCGLQHTDDRFYNSSETALDEFPWLVHIKITDLEYDSEYGDRCSGVIISNRYVLTNAYCAYHAIKVIIGEHKTDTNVSCIADTSLPECTDPTYEIKVEDKIRDGKEANGAYDFALLRLNETLSFTDYIRPVCLPFIQSERPKKNESLTFSGWGSQGPGVITKKRLLCENISNRECYKAQLGLEGNIKFANATLSCVKPQKTNAELACTSDHGGALMYSIKSQWFAEAIVIQMYTNLVCTNNAPIGSIKITPKMLDWILDSVQP